MKPPTVEQFEAFTPGELSAWLRERVYLEAFYYREDNDERRILLNVVEAFDCLGIELDDKMRKSIAAIVLTARVPVLDSLTVMRNDYHADTEALREQLAERTARARNAETNLRRVSTSVESVRRFVAARNSWKNGLLTDAARYAAFLEMTSSADEACEPSTEEVDA